MVYQNRMLMATVQELIIQSTQLLRVIIIDGGLHLKPTDQNSPSKLQIMRKGGSKLVAIRTLENGSRMESKKNFKTKKLR